MPSAISLNHGPLRFNSGPLFRRLLKLRLAITDNWSTFDSSNSRCTIRYLPLACALFRLHHGPPDLNSQVVSVMATGLPNLVLSASPQTKQNSVDSTPDELVGFLRWPKVSAQESRVAPGSKTPDSLGLPDCVLVRLPGQPSDIAQATKFVALTHALPAMANTDLVGIRGR
jgi:hypothetical protein